MFHTQEIQDVIEGEPNLAVCGRHTLSATKALYQSLTFQADIPSWSLDSVGIANSDPTERIGSTGTRNSESAQ
jgi:hypothetical protein